MKKIKNQDIHRFSLFLKEEEKSLSTIDKYTGDIKRFSIWIQKREVTKLLTLEYKKELCEEYSPASVNSVISSLNSFFKFMGWYELMLKTLKIQRKIFADSSRELSKEEYERMLNTAKSKGDERLYYLMQTICSSGIRISELRFITVESLLSEQVEISCKGKIRIVILPKELCIMLKKYAHCAGIVSGTIFVTKNGNPLDRSYIWRLLRKLSDDSDVPEKKVFPHNFRHLFARTYYSLEKDIVRLADILGHTSINTTRIYTIEKGDVHRNQIQKLGLLQC